MRNRKKKIFAAATVLLILILGCGIYVGDYYHAEDKAFAAIKTPSDGISVSINNDNQLVFEPENPIAGFIFYPGGKVEYESYAPLMEACAKKGILCVLVKMPANLAVLDMNAANGIQESFPEISKWYIGGHSLGGSMAASYLEKHADDYEGLILLASYSTANLQETDLDILSVRGSNDKVLNAEKYEENKSNLPEDYHEVIIEGGSHAYFGSYGEQDGDGKASISNEEQVELTAVAIEEFITETKKVGRSTTLLPAFFVVYSAKYSFNTRLAFI